MADKKKKRSSDLFLDLDITDYNDAHLKAVIYTTFDRAFTLLSDALEEMIASLTDADDILNALTVYLQVNQEFSHAAEKKCRKAMKYYKSAPPIQ